MSPKSRKAWAIVCAVILAAAAVTVAVVLVERQRGDGNELPAETETLSPQPTPSRTPRPTPSATPSPRPSPTPPPTPTPYITPPAGRGASGSDIILEPVEPATGTDLD